MSREEKNITQEKTHNTITSDVYTWEEMYNFLLQKDDWHSSSHIMEQCQLSRTQFYNALNQLRTLKLIQVKVDMNDFRKKYYRAIIKNDDFSKK
jgi:predicted transcriptional regulator